MAPPGPRKPLRELTLEEARAIRRTVGPRGVDDQNNPIDLTEAEKKAAQRPGLPEEKKPMKPLISAKLAAVAGVIAIALGLAASAVPTFFPFLPVWVPILLWFLAAVAAFLAGVPLPVYKGPAILPAAAAPAFLTIASALGAYASSLTPGIVQSIVGFIVLLMLAAAGKGVLPPNEPLPTKVIPPHVD